MVDEIEWQQTAIERLLQRDESVLPELVSRCSERLGRVVAAAWPDARPGDVEEVVADVIADAWYSCDEIDPARGTISTWLMMRARYRALDRMRRETRERGVIARLSRLIHPAESELEYASDLDAYLSGLSELDRKLVWLRFVEGQPVSVVSRKCDLTTKAAEHRLSRLRVKLRERYARMETSGGF